MERKRPFPSCVEFEEVSLENEARKVFVVRVPTSVYQVWNSVEEGNKLIGKLRIYHDNKDSTEASLSSKAAKPRATIHINPDLLQQYRTKELALKGTSNVPSADYELKYLQQRVDKPTHMRIFSQGSGGLEFQGQVLDICNLQPLPTRHYFEYAAKRNNQANKKTPNIIPLSFKEAIDLRNNKPQHVWRISSQATDSPSTETDIASKKTNGKELRDQLFKLFQKPDENSDYKTWTLKDLKERTGANAVLLKQVLKDIAVYNKSGPLAKQYQLKPQYK